MISKDQLILLSEEEKCVLVYILYADFNTKLPEKELIGNFEDIPPFTKEELKARIQKSESFIKEEFIPLLQSIVYKLKI